MIVEHALLAIIAGRELEFERAMQRAARLIRRAPGFRRVTVSRCLERPSTYLLIAEWDQLEDHTEGFRGSADYEVWRQELHDFYDPFPDVTHFAPVVQA